jgi:hypothetical protein
MVESGEGGAEFLVCKLSNMKKVIFLLFCIVFFNSLSGQNTFFKGTIVVNDSFGVRGGFVVFPLIKDTLGIDETGIAKIDLSNSSRRIFYFSWTGWKSKVFRFDKKYIDSNLTDVKLPDTSYYKDFRDKKICPVCLHSNEIIPIVYGLPSKKMIRESRRGKYQLGGCIIMETNPQLFCRKDNFEF